MFCIARYAFVYVGKYYWKQTFNQLVERSNRSRPTIFLKACNLVTGFFNFGYAISYIKG